MIQEQICTKCNILKNITDFYPSKNNQVGYTTRCKKCIRNQNQQYYRTKNGLISQIYGTQKNKSKLRKHPQPSYTKQELHEWLFNQPNFHILFKAWEDSNYSHDLVPSIDRIDDYLPYSINNIQLTTWKENNSNGYKDRKNGMNNKHSKGVKQFTKDKVFINSFHSVIEASRVTGINRACINKVCLKQRKSAGNYYWEFI